MRQVAPDSHVYARCGPRRIFSSRWRSALCAANTRRIRTRLRINARSHRVSRRADDSRWRRCRRVVRGCVARGSATSGARASAHQRRCFLSPSLSLSLSPFERARLVDASRCETGSVLHEIEIPARVSRLINVRRSMGPVALGIAEDTCHRHGILSPPPAKSSGISD